MEKYKTINHMIENMAKVNMAHDGMDWYDDVSSRDGYIDNSILLAIEMLRAWPIKYNEPESGKILGLSYEYSQEDLLNDLQGMLK